MGTTNFDTVAATAFQGPVTGAVDGAVGGTTPAAASVTNFTGNGTVNNTPQIVTAAGATQGGATLITKHKAIITVALTNSAKGVRLPVAVTGLEVLIANAATFGCKIYPNTNGKLGASATNAAIVLAINKANRYIAVNTTQWILQVGG